VTTKKEKPVLLCVIHCGQKNNITLLDHPACSPDLNPIENIWGWMAREVYKNGHQFQTVDALREAIFNTWSNVPTSLLETLASILFFDTLISVLRGFSGFFELRS
uniref:Tc1-like transposase DDE domain-containing protein n=1 Tax=Amphilophus citrinellus TaxID=61819 RepID=A0A3Q0SU03_AMPCI